MRFLETEHHEGFCIYRNGHGPVWVCPHAGPSIKRMGTRDSGSDAIASLCWSKTGGTLIISNTPRNRVVGIDFNRHLPPKDMALIFWDIMTSNSERAEWYRSNYAFVAKNEEDYERKRSIYEEFWNSVKGAGNIIIFMHTQNTTLKNFPSLMDVITYKGDGVDKNLVSEIVDEINNKYELMFKKMEKPYKNAIFLEELRFINDVLRKRGEFTLEAAKRYSKARVVKTIGVIKKYVDSEAYEGLIERFNEREFMKAVMLVLRKDIAPKVTVELNFFGDMAKKIKKLFVFKKNIVMDIELNLFLNKWYPDIAASIVLHILSRITSIERYRKLAIKQTRITNFLDRTSSIFS
ncbi:MAG TPA: hypothetical protein ENG42_03405 [Candidatus Aenigmarchaeota archaeon]|nr:MAG: hypothetical protein DRP03_02175 [Candidatus Aenigmarchaeota archaeon]HDD46498.1 hypothetical protein [Candidatus Aenigmarchaeota archaeon]